MSTTTSSERHRFGAEDQRHLELLQGSEDDGRRAAAFPSSTPWGTVAARAPGAWLVLFSCLLASAGHGLFLLVAVTRHALLPSLRDLGGVLLAPAVLWFLAAPLGALAALVARRPLERLAPLPAGLLAAGAATGTGAAFAVVLVKIAAA